MSTRDLLVILAGVAAIVWVNWYFFLAARGVAVARAGGTGPQRTRIVVRGGYEPAAIRVVAGRPVRLEFDRQETSGCTEEVVIPDFGIRAYLPAHKTTAVEFTPTHAGSHEFTCGMAMVRGRIIVDEGTAGER
jgi:plastocyanin domain-containing protein